ncbi:hypothetical protein B0H17DRAFT_1290416 [Mycena rosella]|uniref:Uncharacterized protein n=1 Tax=Mycena rosella TaxID=1033263 RepID=A0AAD7BHZ2_MYCRO|nr:hypothetical protein B0H17DRAFT_1290416 [Mycena rosella]
MAQFTFVSEDTNFGPPVASNSFPTPPIVDRVFSADVEALMQASAVLAQNSLDGGDLNDPRNRWSTQWSETGKVKGDANINCGYDHKKRNTKYDHQADPEQLGSRERHNPLPFTGCLAHVEITLRSNSIIRIRGHLDHNQACKDALFTRIPSAPIHPSIYVVALSQLRDVLSATSIKRTAAFFRRVPTRISRRISTPLPFDDSWSRKTRAPWGRQYNRMKGVDVTDAPQVNVDEWLDPTSDKFNPTLARNFRVERRRETVSKPASPPTR